MYLSEAVIDLNRRLVSIGFESLDFSLCEREFVKSIVLYDYLNENNSLYRYVLKTVGDLEFVVYSDLISIEFELWISSVEYVDAFSIDRLNYVTRWSHVEYMGVNETTLVNDLDKLRDRSRIRVRVGSIVGVRKEVSYITHLFNDFCLVKMRNMLYESFGNYRFPLRVRLLGVLTFDSRLMEYFKDPMLVISPTNKDLATWYIKMIGMLIDVVRLQNRLVKSQR